MSNIQIATVSSPNFGDQGFLNNFFPLWNVLGPNHHLPLTDNLLVRMAGKNLLQNFDDGQVRILHFSGSTKPWNMMTDKQVIQTDTNAITGSCDALCLFHFTSFSNGSVPDQLGSSTIVEPQQQSDNVKLID